MDIFSKDSHILHTSPLPNSGMPPNDTAGYTSMLFNPNSLHNCAALVHNDVPHNVRTTGQFRRRLFPQRVQWVLTDNITVENKKWLSRVIFQLVPGKSQGACRPQWFSFLRTSDFDAKLCLKILQEIQHNLQEETLPKST
ncbi:hypothetical protein CR513_22847, partial [Mucuna pruriens]